MKKNVFFDAALKKAAGLLGRRTRLMVLLGRLSMKIKDVDWNSVQTPRIKDRFSVAGRLLKAYALGHYREVPWKSLLLITGAIVYFITPIDLIPDLVPGLGFTDDFGILLAVFKSVEAEVEKFLVWEKSRPIDL